MDGSCNTSGGCKVVCLLIVVGALNWGLVGLGYFLGKDLNLVTWLFTSLLGMMTLEYIVYLLVGVAGVMKLMCCFSSCKK